jgi:hypothetical protein
MWVWVNLPYACYGLEVQDGKIVTAPPIAYWMLGKDKEVVKKWLAAKGAQVVVLDTQSAN